MEGRVSQRDMGNELGDLLCMNKIDLTDPLVRARVEERWGGDPPPDEIVISPESIFRSDLLVTVAEG